MKELSHEHLSVVPRSRATSMEWLRWVSRALCILAVLVFANLVTASEAQAETRIVEHVWVRWGPNTFVNPDFNDPGMQQAITGFMGVYVDTLLAPYQGDTLVTIDLRTTKPDSGFYREICIIPGQSNYPPRFCETLQTPNGRFGYTAIYADWFRTGPYSSTFTNADGSTGDGEITGIVQAAVRGLLLQLLAGSPCDSVAPASREFYDNDGNVHYSTSGNGASHPSILTRMGNTIPADWGVNPPAGRSEAVSPKSESDDKSLTACLAACLAFPPLEQPVCYAACAIYEVVTRGWEYLAPKVTSAIKAWRQAAKEGTPELPGGGNPPPPGPGGGGGWDGSHWGPYPDPPTDVVFIAGLRDGDGLSEELRVEAEVSLEGNATWDFGVRVLGHFYPLVEAGSVHGCIAFPPYTQADFAVRSVASPDDSAGFAMSDFGVGTIESSSDAIPADKSVYPVTSADYYHTVRFSLHPDGNQSSPGVTVTLTAGQVDQFDGLSFALELPVPVLPTVNVSATARNGIVEVRWAPCVPEASVFLVIRAPSPHGPFSAVSERIEGAAGKLDFRFQDLDVSPGTQYFYKVGCYTRERLIWSDVVAVSTPTASLALYSPRPNPSNGPVSVRYEVPTEGRIQITLFDVSGRRIRTLFEGLAPAGAGSILWDGRDVDGKRVPAGMYFIRLALGSQVLSQRVVRLN